MPSRVEINSINKTNRNSACERIEYIGGIYDDGRKWRLTQQDAISGIEKGLWSFYISEDGHVVNVVVAISAQGNKYIKTENDVDQPEYLLRLPEGV